MTTVYIDDPTQGGDPDWLHDGEELADAELAYNPNQPRHPAGSSVGGRWAPAGGRYRGSAAAETERVAALARRGIDPSDFDGPVMHRGIAVEVSPELKRRIDTERYSTEDPEDFNRALHLGPVIAEQLLGFEGHQGIERTGGIGQSWTTREGVAESVSASGASNLVVKVTARARQQDIVIQEVDTPDGRTMFVDSQGNQVGKGRETDLVSGEMEVRVHGQSPLDIIDVQIATGSGIWESVWGDVGGYGAGAEELYRMYPSLREELAFNPNQPRHPAGSSEGGRFAPVGQRVSGLAEPDAGFTRSVRTLEPITSGIAVALDGTDILISAAEAFPDGPGTAPDRHLTRMVMDRITVARNTVVPEGTERALGAWHNPDDGLIEVNVTAVFPSDQRDQAFAFAQDQNQIAMADLDAIARDDWDNAIVPTGGTGGNRSTLAVASDATVDGMGRRKPLAMVGIPDDWDDLTDAEQEAAVESMLTDLGRQLPPDEDDGLTRSD